jgi:hypothetical protein
MSAQRLFPVLLACALAACASAPRVDRILEDGNCATAPDIERLIITMSDYGSKVEFRWSRTRFAGMVVASSGAPATDASYGANQVGEWERRFPAVSATTTIPGAFLGFPAASNAGAGVLAAAVYDEQYPVSGSPSSAVVVVDLKTHYTQLVGMKGRVSNVVWSPKGDYVAVLEIAPAARLPGFLDMFTFSAPPSRAQFDIYATIYSASGLAACTRRVASGLPTPSPTAAWR